MRMLKWLAATLAVMLAACGGGGGGGDAPPSNELRIGSITPASINATFSNGGSNRRVTLNAGYSGQLTGTVVVVIEDPDAVFDGAFVRIGAGSTVDLDLYVSDTAPVGRHTRPLVIHVCSDFACTRELSGFPRTVPKDVTITGTSVGTSSLQFTSTAGTAPAYQIVTVTPPNGVDYSIDQQQYIQVTAPNGQESVRTVGSVFYTQKTSTGFVVAPLPVAAGRYVGLIPVMTPGYGTVYVSVDYLVTDPNGAVLTPLASSVAASGYFGATGDLAIEFDVLRNLMPIDNSFISIEHPSGTDSSIERWLRYDSSTYYTPTGGQVDSGQRLRLYANACLSGQSCLPHGTYTATVVYTASAYGQTSTVRIPVTFSVN